MTQEKKTGIGKSLLNFLRSMRFGMILLILILILALIGSLIEQGREAAFYTENYSEFGGIIVALGFDHIYTAWYFAALFGLLCVNLLFCSVLRSLGLKNADWNLRNGARNGAVNVTASPKALQKWMGNRRLKVGDVVVRKYAGFYGSLITHLGLLLLILSAAATLTLHTDAELPLSIGESKEISGVTVTAVSFRTRNDEGETDYHSNITLTDSRGNSRSVDLSVNHPAKMGNLKFYQQSYNFEGIPVEISTTAAGSTESLLFTSDDIMNGMTFLTLDGKTGIELDDIYANVQTNEDGTITPLSSSTGVMSNPAYLVNCIQEKETTKGIVFPGTQLEAGGVYATFGEPQFSPVLMVKESPAWVLPVLYTSFGVLLLGFFLCFCVDPCAIAVKENGLCVRGRKSTEDAAEKILDEIKEENV